LLRFVLALLSTWVVVIAFGEPTEKAYMVWGSECLTEISKGHETHLEAPLKDNGEPDMKLAKMIGVHAVYKPACGHIEIRHE
jgi:hypothetical protein